jgi:hypothetical protein
LDKAEKFGTMVEASRYSRSCGKYPMGCNACCLPGKSSHQFYGSGHGESAFIAQY